MLKFNEEKQLESITGGLALRPEIEGIVDSLFDRGFDGLYFLGIGGTYASSLQVETYLKGKSNLPVYVQHAAEYYTTGNKRITDQSIVVLSSVTGTTQEVVQAVEELRKIGACIIGFVDVPDSPLAKAVTHAICREGNEQLKFFMLADRFMYKNGEFSDYEAYYQELDQYLAKDLVAVEKAADTFGKEFAEKHRHDEMHYFIGAGNQWGSTYSYAMCYWEEQSWLPSKSIHAAEFLHGTLEIVDEFTPVTIFVGEDEQRPLAERVVNLLPKICGNYTVIDSKDYALPGISDEYRGRLSHLVMHCVTQRIDAHVEKMNCHPLEIRRYYRQFPY